MTSRVKRKKIKVKRKKKDMKTKEVKILKRYNTTEFNGNNI